MTTLHGFPVVPLPGPRGVRLVSTARLRDPVLNTLIDTDEERRAIEEIEAFSSVRLSAERRGTASIGAGEFVRGVAHAAFINAAFCLLPATRAEPVQRARARRTGTPASPAPPPVWPKSPGMSSASLAGLTGSMPRIEYAETVRELRR